MAFGDTYRCDTKQQAQGLFPTLTKWKFSPASNGRMGINAMFNHGPEWHLIGPLGIVFARVSAMATVMHDGANIHTRIEAL